MSSQDNDFEEASSTYAELEETHEAAPESVAPPQRKKGARVQAKDNSWIYQNEASASDEEGSHQVMGEYFEEEEEEDQEDLSDLIDDNEEFEQGPILPRGDIREPEDDVEGYQQLAKDFDERLLQKETVFVEKAPSARDPHLWVLHTRPGKELLAVLELSRIITDAARDGEGMNISGIVTRLDHPGMVYVESPSRREVTTLAFRARLITGAVIPGVRRRRNQQSAAPRAIPVPRASQLPILKVDEGGMYKVGDIARVRSGLHKGDLCVIHSISFTARMATVKIQPRFRTVEDINNYRMTGWQGPQKAEGRVRQGRPAPRKLRDADVKAFQERYGEEQCTIDTDGCLTLGARKFQNGLLLLNVRLSSLVVGKTEVAATAKELADFSLVPGAEAGAGTGAVNLMRGVSQTALSKIVQSSFSIPVAGERVVVIDGDLEGRVGVVREVMQDTAHIAFPSSEGGADSARCPTVWTAITSIRRFFSVGDHVAVLAPGGTSEEKSGLVTAVLEGGALLRILMDHSEEQVTTRAALCKFSMQEKHSQVSLGRFRMKDLVSTGSGARQVGVIVGISHESVTVLDIHNRREAFPTRRLRKLFSETYTASYGTLKTGETVRIIVGDYRRTEGVVLHIHSQHAFVELSQTSSALVSNLPMTSPAAQKGRGSSGVDPRAAGQASINVICIPCEYVRPVSLNEVKPEDLARQAGIRDDIPTAFKDSAFRPGGRRIRSTNSQLVGKTLLVVRGEHKGCCGIVKQAGEETLSLLIPAKANRIVRISKSFVDNLYDDSQGGRFQIQATPYEVQEDDRFNQFAGFGDDFAPEPDARGPHGYSDGSQWSRDTADAPPYDAGDADWHGAPGGASGQQFEDNEWGGPAGNWSGSSAAALQPAPEDDGGWGADSYQNPVAPGASSDWE